MLAFASLALAFMLFGCLLRDQNGDPLNEFVASSDLTVTKYVPDADLICRELPGDKPCYCMACSNKTSYGPLGIGYLLSSFYNSNLRGGNCSISQCNQSDYVGIVQSDNNTQMRVFGLGAGQSFVSGGHANLYCNYTLQIATKWMKGAQGSPPRVPLVSRSACWLERSMLPLYIYYSGGKGISFSRSREIASSFQADNTGPVMLTTEVWLNGSDDSEVASVRQQVDALRMCDKCMVILAVKPNDYGALYKLLGVPGAIDHSIYDKIDAVGFGFRANDYAHCDSAEIIHENINFSRYILQKYNKPTIWLYVGASEGNSSDGSCQWTGESAADFYQEIMGQTGNLPSAGVLGMSLYEFVDGTGPLPCNGVQGCDFGMLLANGTQKHPVMNAWSDMCQEIGENSEYRTPLIFSKNGQGSACDVMPNDQPSFHLAQSIGSSQAFSYSEAVPLAAVKGLGCGETCPGNGTSMPKPSAYDSTGNSFDAKNCSAYPVIDERADDLDISATYMRAEFAQESGFDNWVVSCNAAPCGTPLGTTMEDICAAAGYPPGAACLAHTLFGDGKSCPQNKPYFCAYGLAQCIELPGQYYVKNSQSLPAAIQGCGAENYNPFDAGQSACCGAGKFAAFLRDGSGATAEKFVHNNWAELSKCSGGMADDEKGWAAYYLASNMYAGTTWNVLSQFISQRDSNGDCTGTQHYIDYLRSRATANDDTGYGAKVMSRYRAAAGKCDSDCPK